MLTLQDIEPLFLQRNWTRVEVKAILWELKEALEKIKDLEECLITSDEEQNSESYTQGWDDGVREAVDALRELRGVLR